MDLTDVSPVVRSKTQWKYSRGLEYKVETRSFHKQYKVWNRKNKTDAFSFVTCNTKFEIQSNTHLNTWNTKYKMVMCVSLAIQSWDAHVSRGSQASPVDRRPTQLTVNNSTNANTKQISGQYQNKYNIGTNTNKNINTNINTNTNTNIKSRTHCGYLEEAVLSSKLFWASA